MSVEMTWRAIVSVGRPKRREITNAAAAIFISTTTALLFCRLYQTPQLVSGIHSALEEVVTVILGRPRFSEWLTVRLG